MSSPRRLFAGILFGFVLATAPVAAQQEQFLPQGFFDSAQFSGGGQAAVEADLLSYDAINDVITASGGVVMKYEGYTLRADKLVYHRKTGALTAKGEVGVTDPKGTTFVTHDLEVTGGYKQAFMRSLTLRTADGHLVTADAAEYSSELQVILHNGMYSPCGECIDAKGRRIGWKVRAARLIYNREDATVTLEQPVLELLGIPLALVPWLRLPDPTQPRATGFRTPTLDYTDKMGVALTYPYFVAVGEDTDLWLSPRLMSRQGGLFAAEATHRFGNLGSVSARVAAVYQLDRSAFTATVGDRDWRGAFQTAGSFVPLPNWTVGWSYTAFTDAAFLPDYKLVTGKNSVNEVYATYLTRDYYADLRLQQFNLLGNYTPAQQLQQGAALPNARASSVTDIPGMGQVRTALRVLGVQRAADHTGTYGAVPYVFGYEENKAHATIEASWQQQFILPGGVAVTPYLGLRGDAAWYDGSSPLLAGPVSMLTATPIAALDVRWPLVMDDGLSSYLFEPIAQLVYRGSGTAAPGITNDNALSFAFDDTNLFSYDRFSGTDRQETGLRANLGGHFLANFADGSWLDLVGGQSYFLAGVNSLAIADSALVGANSGLGAGASYFVLGARAGITNELLAGAKLQIDPATPKVTMATVGGSYFNTQRFSAALDYTYIGADPVVGRVTDQHEVSALVGVPIADYWTATANAAWDITANNWLEAGLGVRYDDGYLDFGAGASITGPTHTTPNDLRWSASFHLKAPGGLNYGMSH